MSQWVWQVLGPFPYGKEDFAKEHGPEQGVDLAKVTVMPKGK